MSWRIKKKAQALVASEEGVVRKDWGGRVSVALVYPNTYAVGMSNLGFQTIYDHLNRLPDVVASACSSRTPRISTSTREPAPRRSRSSPSAPSATSTWSASRSPTRATTSTRCASCAWPGIPVRAADRGPGDPLVLMGGVCAFSNPEPMAPFMDLVVVGEGEEVVAEIVAAYRTASDGDREGARERALTTCWSSRACTCRRRTRPRAGRTAARGARRRFVRARPRSS